MLHVNFKKSDKSAMIHSVISRGKRPPGGHEFSQDQGNMFQLINNDLIGNASD